jgi:hypothetical protein
MVTFENLNDHLVLPKEKQLNAAEIEKISQVLLLD